MLPSGVWVVALLGLASGENIRRTPYPMHLLPCDSWDHQTFIPTNLNASADPNEPSFFTQPGGVDLVLTLRRDTNHTEHVNLAINITG